MSLTSKGAGVVSVDLRDLHAANIARQAEWCPDQVPDLSFRGNELAGETGEACNVIKKLERERQGWRGSRATTADLADELADVVICADLCAVTVGIDLGAAVVAKFNATSEKQGLATRLQTEPARDLWCVHILGPDDLHAAPDFWTALAWTVELNGALAKKAAAEKWAADDDCPRIQAVVARWPWSPEAHAESLAKELAKRAAHEERRRAAATPTSEA